MEGPSRAGRPARADAPPLRVRVARALVLLALAPVFVLLVSGCGGPESMLDPASRPARDIENLWWIMFVGGWIVFGGAVLMLFIGYARRNRSGLPGVKGDRTVYALVLAGGLVAPIVVLVALFALVVDTMPATSAPRPGTTALTIEVIGHQWFWEVRYPGTTAVTANEIHIPARTPVNVVVRTADVIHSFWVPRLNRKIDMIPGRTNRVLIEADHPGVYRGQCSEFCGPQHAHMAFAIHADPPARYRAWLENMASPRRAPTSALEQQGEQDFMNEPCAGCHAIRGTSAHGRTGPDLTHVGSRRTLAALTIRNTPALMRRWIEDPQGVKPESRMPGLQLSDDQFRAIAAYLESLR